MMILRNFLRLFTGPGAGAQAGRSRPRPRMNCTDRTMKSTGMMRGMCPALSRCYQVDVSLASSFTQPVPACCSIALALPIRMKLSTSSKTSRKRDSLDDEYAVERHFPNSNPINKYLDPEENCSKSLEEMAREQKRKLGSIEKARAARYFSEGSEGPERRTLSWDTIDQIRYLRQENPTEWTVAMLAESFNVSPEVIGKVLKSKFTPNKKVREKQDKSVAESTGYQPRKVKAQTVMETAKLNPGLQKEMPKCKSFNKQSYARSNEKKTLQRQHKIARSHRHVDNTSAKKSSVVEKMNAHDTEVDFTFGRFDFENIDSMMGQVTLKPQVFRKGRNFYNENGEFLYRI